MASAKKKKKKMYQQEKIARNQWMDASNRGNGADSEEDNDCQQQGAITAELRKEKGMRKRVFSSINNISSAKILKSQRTQ